MTLLVLTRDPLLGNPGWRAPACLAGGLVLTLRKCKPPASGFLVASGNSSAVWVSPPALEPWQAPVPELHSPFLQPGLLCRGPGLSSPRFPASPPAISRVPGTQPVSAWTRPPAPLLVLSTCPSVGANPRCYPWALCPFLPKPKESLSSTQPLS